MTNLTIKRLIAFSVICCACGLLFSFCLPGTGCEVFAQSTAEIPAGTNAMDTDESHLIAYGDPAARVFGVLALIVCCAAIGRFAARKLKQSQVLGELAVGIIVGAIAYQLGSPTVIIIRHSELIQQTNDRALSEGENWETTVRSTLGRAGLPKEVAERVERVLLRSDFPSYLLLARSIQLFASFGVAMLLFMVGLEVSLKELRSIGVSASAVALTGVGITFGLVFLTTLLLLPKTAGLMPPLFAGAALCASSVGIAARIFRDMRRIDMKEAKLVLGAAIMDDVLGLIVLAMVTAVATRGAVEIGHLFWILLKTALFLGAVVIFGTRFLQKTVQFLARLDLGNIKLLYPFALLMLLAWLADKIGLAAIIGAFAAGVVIKEESFSGIGPGLDPDQSVESILAPFEGILAPIFFVLVGLQVNLAMLANVKVMLSGLVISTVAVAGKLASSLAVRGGANRLIVGAGMLPRVEVALIVASMGKSLGVLDDALFSVIIMVVLLTVLMTPPLLKWAIEVERN
ncbi:MAG: cation:proton antiporter [Syntrophobacteraceae bacterium]